jgi:hypothetical protein
VTLLDDSPRAAGSTRSGVLRKWQRLAKFDAIDPMRTCGQTSGCKESDHNPGLSRRDGHHRSGPNGFVKRNSKGEAILNLKLAANSPDL